MRVTHLKKSLRVSIETYWASASLLWSTRSWFWLPSRLSEPRSSRCTAVVCRSKKKKKKLTPGLPLLQTHSCVQMDDVVVKVESESARKKKRASSSRLKERRADLSATCTPLFTPPSHTSSHLSMIPSFLAFFCQRGLLGDELCSVGIAEEWCHVTFCDLYLHFDLWQLCQFWRIVSVPGSGTLTEPFYTQDWGSEAFWVEFPFITTLNHLKEHTVLIYWFYWPLL